MANLHITPVASLDAPELSWYLTLKRVEEHERAGVLVATNAKVVQRLLASRFTVSSALLTPAWLEKLEPQLRARPEEITVFIAEQKLLETITGYQMHQGALAVAKIPPQPGFASLLETSPRPLLLAAVEGIASAENLGAVVRNCAAFGAHFLVVGETCGSPFQRRAVSGSMGTIFEQPVAQVENLVEALIIINPLNFFSIELFFIIRLIKLLYLVVWLLHLLFLFRHNIKLDFHIRLFCIEYYLLYQLKQTILNVQNRRSLYCFRQHIN